MALVTIYISGRGGQYATNVEADPIDFYQEKTNVYVLDVDGKECKMDLVRQERVIKPPLPASPSIK